MKKLFLSIITLAIALPAFAQGFQWQHGIVSLMPVSFSNETPAWNQNIIQDYNNSHK
jgi:hypothetical protein